jgi:hypothetical protein
MTDLRATGVWISADSARIVQWSPESTWRHRIDSGVPGRHRATGRAPTQQHGQGDGRRDEHMRAFFERVVHVLSLDDLLLVGDGEVVGHFADEVRAYDAKRGRERRIEVVESGPLTERQLVARIRAFAGHPAVRRTGGADARI